MIFYSLRKIFNKTGRSSKQIILAFRAHISSHTPKNIYDPLYKYYYTDFSGESYMLNPHELVQNVFRWSNREVAQYIALASFRSYTEYTLTKDASLDLLHSVMDKDNINKNRLLRIVDNKVRFYYEEDISRRNKIWH
jgi:hypothetical protein